MLVVPTFTVVRSMGEAPGFAPAVSSWLRRRHSPRPAGPDTRHRSDSSPRRPPTGCRCSTRIRTALPPRSTGFERVDDQEALRHRFLSCTVPSRSPGPTHPVVLDRPDFVAAAPTQTRRSPDPGCRQLHPAATTAERWWSLTSIRNNSASWRTMCSSTPIVRTPALRSGRSVRAVASAFTAVHSVCQSTRKCRASADTVVSSWASASVAHATAARSAPPAARSAGGSLTTSAPGTPARSRPTYA